MDSQGRESALSERRWEADSPALAGVSGRMRLAVGGKSVGVLSIDDGHLRLTEDDSPVDITVNCATRADLIKLLRGEINPIVSALRGIIRLRGDRTLAVKVILGLRAGSPFVHTPFDGKDA